MLNIFRRKSKEDKEYYRLLKEIFGLRPNNVEIYKLALIHRSASRFLKKGVPINNERLEFLGDAVIESVVSDYLFVAFPYEKEGFLTQMRSRMVNRATLNELCKDIGLAKHIRNNANGGGVQRNMNGDAFEAMIGAMYLDKGYGITSKTLIKLLEKNITLDELRTTETDFKSRLIEWCQKGRHHLRFSTSFGPDGKQNAPQFKSVAIIDGFEVGYGLGSSKKEAEQRAAYTVSQALSDDMGERILDMVDKSAGDASIAAKPKRRRKRGGVKHCKVASSTETTESRPEAHPEERKKENEVVETTVADGVVSISVEEAVKSDTGTSAKRRGRPRKVRPEETDKPEAEKKEETMPVSAAPKRRGRPRKAVAESGKPMEKPKNITAKTKPVAEKKQSAVKEAEVKPKAKPGRPPRKVEMNTVETAGEIRPKAKRGRPAKPKTGTPAGVYAKPAKASKPENSNNE